jgi:hypothetical protein
MGKPGDRIRIPLPEKKALELLLKVKPTADMPRPGAHPSKAKKKQKRSK